jgi:hypothetical protein
VVPAPGLEDAQLLGVSAASASDIWTVGAIAAGTSSHQNPLIAHYDGSAWTPKSSNVPGTDGGALYSVDARTANDAWAVGFTGGNSTPLHALILHWDGSNWSPDTTIPPAQSADDTQVIDVSADSATDAWAVGRGPGISPFMLRWNGSRWNPVDFPAPASTVLTAVTALSPDSAYVAGYTSTSPKQPVLMHWDGAHWAQASVPNPGGGAGSVLADVTATSATSLFVLSKYPTSRSRTTSVVMHWDGSSWTGAALPLPGQGADDIISSIGASATGQAWAVGSTLAVDPRTPIAAPVPVVPNVTGDRPGEANATLATYGLTGNGALNQTTNCPASSSGLVVSTDPVAGQQEPFGLAVSLTVCAAPATVAVPSVLSQGDQDAQNAITAAGLTVGPITMRANCTEPHGAVLIQNPDPGVQVTPGTPVSLVESTGRQPNGRPCVIN